MKSQVMPEKYNPHNSTRLNVLYQKLCMIENLPYSLSDLLLLDTLYIIMELLTTKLHQSKIEPQSVIQKIFFVYSSHHSNRMYCFVCFNIFGDRKFILLVIRISKIQIRKLQSRLSPRQHLIQKNSPQSNAPKKRLIRVLQLLKQLTSLVQKYCEGGTLHLSYNLRSTFYHINIFRIIVQNLKKHNYCTRLSKS